MTRTNVIIKPFLLKFIISVQPNGLNVQSKQGLGFSQKYIFQAHVLQKCLTGRSLAIKTHAYLYTNINIITPSPNICVCFFVYYLTNAKQLGYIFKFIPSDKFAKMGYCKVHKVYYLRTPKVPQVS